jgi:Zn-finger protein
LFLRTRLKVVEELEKNLRFFFCFFLKKKKEKVDKYLNWCGIYTFLNFRLKYTVVLNSNIAVWECETKLHYTNVVHEILNSLNS